MAENQPKRSRAVFIVLLVILIIVGSLLAWLGYRRHEPVEITLTQVSRQVSARLVAVDGAVASPGLYPLQPGDTIETIVTAAGGLKGAAPDELKLYIPAAGQPEGAQKININRAEVWLLEALPGIGEIKAKAIVDYRRQKGLFRQAGDVAAVDGIGLSIYEKIKDLISVTD